MTWPGFRKVYVGDDPADSAIVVGLLRAAGISASTSNDYLWGGRGALPVTIDTAPTVWVLEASFAAARAVLTRRDAAPEDTPWFCKQCGTDGDPGFSLCWKCGASR